jgi:hypothetical protein
MRDKTANVEMQSQNFIATSGAAAKMSAGQLEVPTIEFPMNLRELAEEAVMQTRESYERIETAALDRAAWQGEFDPLEGVILHDPDA